MLERKLKITSKITEEDWRSHWSEKHPNLDKLILDHLVFEGQLDTAKAFASQKCLPLEIDVFHTNRHKIRLLIEEGNIDSAISTLNDLHANFLDLNVFVYYQLLAQKVNEMIYRKEDQEAIIKYMQDEIAPLIEDNNDLQKCLEDLMEYLVFGEGDIQAKRNDVASYVNRVIMETNKMEDPLKKMVSDVVNGEKNLLDKYQHPLFESYCK